MEYVCTVQAKGFLQNTNGDETTHSHFSPYYGILKWALNQREYRVICSKRFVPLHASVLCRSVCNWANESQAQTPIQRPSLVLGLHRTHYFPKIEGKHCVKQNSMRSILKVGRFKSAMLETHVYRQAIKKNSTEETTERVLCERPPFQGCLRCIRVKILGVDRFPCVNKKAMGIALSSISMLVLLNLLTKCIGNIHQIFTFQQFWMNSSFAAFVNILTLGRFSPTKQINNNWDTFP